MDIQLLDVDNLGQDERERLERAIFTYRKYPFFVFHDRFMVSVLSKNRLDETEKAIMERSLNECALNLRSYYQSIGQRI